MARTKAGSGQQRVQTKEYRVQMQELLASISNDCEILRELIEKHFETPNNKALEEVVERLVCKSTGYLVLTNGVLPY